MAKEWTIRAAMQLASTTNNQKYNSSPAWGQFQPNFVGANGPTPGNWTMIFAGAGRATVNVGSVANVALGNAVFPDTNHLGKFEGAADFPATPGKVGIAVSPGTSGNTAVAYYPEIILRFIS